ncbi:MAG: hypothetical protein C4321_06610 [Chloroflexota bacterium]
MRGEKSCAIGHRAHWISGLTLLMGITACLLTTSVAASAQTTSQEWEFTQQGGAAGSEAKPNPVNNPFGSPTLTTGDNVGYILNPPQRGRSGILEMFGGTATFTIPNGNTTLMRKTMKVTIEYQFRDDPNATLTPRSDVAVKDPAGTAFNQGGSSETRPDANGWRTLKLSFSFGSCPAKETVAINAGTVNNPLWLNLVRIDTDCVAIPEPGSLALLALGGAPLLRRYKRRASHRRSDATGFAR